jgi:hypothetical protein
LCDEGQQRDVAQQHGVGRGRAAAGRQPQRAGADDQQRRVGQQQHGQVGTAALARGERQRSGECHERTARDLVALHGGPGGREQQQGEQIARAPDRAVVGGEQGQQGAGVGVEVAEGGRVGRRQYAGGEQDGLPAAQQQACGADGIPAQAQADER